MGKWIVDFNSFRWPVRWGIDKKYRIWRKKKLNIQKAKWKKIKRGNNVKKVKKIHYVRTKKHFYGISTENELLTKESKGIAVNWIKLGLTNVKYVSSNKNYIYTISTNGDLYTKTHSDIKVQKESLDQENTWTKIKNSEKGLIAIAFDEDIMYGITNSGLFKKKTKDINSDWVKIEGIQLLDIEFRTGYLFAVGNNKKVFRKARRIIKSKWINYESCCLNSFTFGIYSGAQTGKGTTTTKKKKEQPKSLVPKRRKRKPRQAQAGRGRTSRTGGRTVTESKRVRTGVTTSPRSSSGRTSSRTRARAQPATRTRQRTKSQAQEKTKTRTRTRTRAEPQKTKTRTRTRTRTRARGRR